MSRPRRCPSCKGSRLVDRSIYAGDYHSAPVSSDWDEQWQCVRCGSVWAPGVKAMRFRGATPITLQPFEIDDAKVPVKVR